MVVMNPSRILSVSAEADDAAAASDASTGINIMRFILVLPLIQVGT